MASAPSIVVQFPGVPFQNLPSVANFAVLRARSVADVANDSNIIVNYGLTAGDLKGGTYAWVAGSLLDDNGTTIIRPTEIAPLQAGRWISVEGGGDGAVDGLRMDLAASSGAASIFTAQSGAGAVSRSVQTEIRATVTPEQFRASGDADDTASIMRAHDSLPVGGGEIMLANGKTYTYTTLTFTKPITLRGRSMDNSGGTRLVTSTTTGNAITLTTGCSMRDLSLSASAPRTSGAMVYAGQKNRLLFSNIWIDSYYIGFDIDGGSEINFWAIRGQNATQRSVSPGGSHIRLGYTNYTGSVIIRDSYLRGRDPASGTMGDDNQCSYGIQMRFVDVVNIAATTLIYSGYACMIDPQNGQTASLIFSEGVTWDTSTDGVRLIPAGTGAVIRAGFRNGWMGANTGNGVTITSAGGIVDGVSIAGNRIIANGSCGTNVDGTATYGTQVSNIDVNDNDIAANTVAGARFDNGCTGRLRNNRLGATDGAPANGLPVQYGTGTIYVSDNKSYVTANRGNVTMTSGSAAVTITHGLARTPLLGDIDFALTSSATQGFYIDATTVTSTQFAIKATANVGADTGINWRADKITL